jgi:nucleotide-binding universal stress UspA family protein
MYKKILIGLDGSKYSLAGGDIALELANRRDTTVLAAHVYDSNIHSHRLREMEPDLPERFQEKKALQHIRDSHNELIYDGFKALSKGYIEEFEKKAIEKGINIEQVYREGRNYSGLLEIAKEFEADLMVIGAYGLGFTGNDTIGSTTIRLLKLATCDLLIARGNLSGGEIMAGVDGSKGAIKALKRAITWANTFDRKLRLVSAYDPFFHGKVFNTMAGALSSERQEDVGLNKQQSLHDNIVDEGLGKLYGRFLDAAEAYLDKSGIEYEKSLLKGKAYRVLVDLAKDTSPDIIAVGRFGHHRDNLVQVGSNTEAIVRLTDTNVLIVGAE